MGRALYDAPPMQSQAICLFALLGAATLAAGPHAAGCAAQLRQRAGRGVTREGGHGSRDGRDGVEVPAVRGEPDLGDALTAIALEPAARKLLTRLPLALCIDADAKLASGARSRRRELASGARGGGR